MNRTEFFIYLDDVYDFDAWLDKDMMQDAINTGYVGFLMQKGSKNAALR
jgi:hypothetical protein